MYNGPYKPRKSNRTKHTRGLKLKFFKEDSPGDPNAPYGGLGPLIPPPSTRVKNLSAV
jgi:hypothetical protein